MSSILPKNELENVHFFPSLQGQKFFVHFFGELKKPKIFFEINRPLVIGEQIAFVFMFCFLLINQSSNW